MPVDEYGALDIKQGPDHPLLPVLEKWTHLQKRYAEAEGDAAYYHTEMGNTSLLVAAAYQHGWHGLAEHYVERTEKEGDSHNGRVDAYIGNAERGFFIETKMCWTRPLGSAYPKLTKKIVINSQKPTNRLRVLAVRAIIHLSRNIGVWQVRI